SDHGLFAVDGHRRAIARTSRQVTPIDTVSSMRNPAMRTVSREPAAVAGAISGHRRQGVADLRRLFGFTEKSHLAGPPPSRVRPLPRLDRHPAPPRTCRRATQVGNPLPTMSGWHPPTVNPVFADGLPTPRRHRRCETRLHRINRRMRTSSAWDADLRRFCAGSTGTATRAGLRTRAPFVPRDTRPPAPLAHPCAAPALSPPRRARAKFRLQPGVPHLRTTVCRW